MVTWRRRSGDLDRAPGQQMLYAAPAFDHDRSGIAALRGQRAGSSADPKVKAVAAVHEWKLDGTERFRPVRAEHQPVVACFKSGETPLQ
jgi:hypothetical protein